MRCVIMSSSSTRSSPSGMTGLSLKRSLRTWNRTSTMYWTRLSMSLSLRMVRNRSKMPLLARAECSARKAPTSRMNETAISTLSSVGRSRRRTRTWSASTSCATCWLTSWARKVVVAVMVGLSLRLKLRRNWWMRRCRRSSPIWGSLVLTMAVRDAKMGVNGSDDAWARMRDRTRRPLPRIRFSPKSCARPRAPSQFRGRRGDQQRTGSRDAPRGR